MRRCVKDFPKACSTTALKKSYSERSDGMKSNSIEKKSGSQDQIGSNQAAGFEGTQLISLCSDSLHQRIAL